MNWKCKIGLMNCDRIKAGYDCSGDYCREFDLNPDWQIDEKKVIWAMMGTALLTVTMLLFSLAVIGMLIYQFIKCFG